MLMKKTLVIGNKQSHLGILLKKILLHNCIIESIQAKNNILKRVKIIRPGAIFIDVATSNLFNNLEICKIIKDDPETKSIDITIFTDFEDEEAAAKCLELNTTNFLTKPPEYLELLTKLRKGVQVEHFGDIKEEHEILSLFKEAQQSKIEWERSLDCIDDIIILTDLNGKILRCNKKLFVLTAKNYDELYDKKLENIFNENGFERRADNPYDSDHIDIIHRSGNIFHLNSRAVKDAENVEYGKVVYLHNVTNLEHLKQKIKKSEKDIKIKNTELETAYENLKNAQSKIIQQEKMASIGQLAAGIAHEINNPIGFIMSNINSLRKYTARMVEFIKTQSRVIHDLANPKITNIDIILNNLRGKELSLKLDYIIDDIEMLINETIDGANRINRIVRELMSFSRANEEGYKLTNIESGLDSIINIVWNELKHKATLKKKYGNIPLVKCNPGQINQVFMNILINSVQAIENHGEIILKTWHKNGHIYVSIADTGCGVNDKFLNRLFDPFFTTKDPGKGVGLGLSISYDIIKKHDGEICVNTKVGAGTTFTVKIPIKT